MMTVNPGRRPPVVFISAIGGDGASWRPVLDRLTCGATTVTYDRPGLGSAPPRPAPNPPLPYSAFADELAAALDASGVTEPAVVVGHSAGSLIARVYADRHAARVAGVVHVDGSIPRLALWPIAEYGPRFDGDGPGATEFDMLAGEIEVIEAGAPDVPAAVVARTPGRWPDHFPPEADALWTAYQRQLARQHRCPLVVAAAAGHLIPQDDPALVARVVDEVVAAVR